MIVGAMEAYQKVCIARETYKKSRSNYKDLLPLVFVWQPTDHTESRPEFVPCTSRIILDQMLSALGLKEVLDDALEQCDLGEVTDLLVVIGVRRPFPIVWDRHGLSPDPEARKFELRAFLLHSP